MLDMRNNQNIDLLIFYSAVFQVFICRLFKNFLAVRDEARAYLNEHGHLIGWH